MEIKIIKIGVVVILGFLLSGCTSVRVWSDKGKSEQLIRHYYVMPSNINIRYQGRGIPKEQFEEELKAKMTIDSVVKSKLNKMGCAEAAFSIIPDSLNYEYRVKLLDIHKNMDNAFEQLYSDIYISKKKAYNKEVSLGSDVQYFNSNGSADILIFSRMIGLNFSPMITAVDCLRMGMVSNLTSFRFPFFVLWKPRGFMLIAAVDANTGDVLWSNYSTFILSVNSKAVSSKTVKMIKCIDKEL